MFDYLRTPDMPTEPQGQFVFGRRDPRLAHKMGQMSTAGLATYFMVSGGWGKDSGTGWDTHVAESDFIIDFAVSEEGIPRSQMHQETTCLTGWDGARLGLREIRRKHLPADELTVIAHATSLLRLTATTESEAKKAGMPTKFHKVPTDYPFNPKHEPDQYEVASELLRLADWPSLGVFEPQTDLPANLVDFARSITTTPKIPSLTKMALLRHTPFWYRKAMLKHQVAKSTA